MKSVNTTLRSTVLITWSDADCDFYNSHVAFFFCLLIQPKTLAVNGTPRIAPASLWTRPKVQEFIQHVKSDPSSVLVVGRGETMTVRVPTHEGGEEL